MFSNEKFALAMMKGAREVEASSLLPSGHCAKKAKPAAPRWRRAERRRESLGQEGPKLETWEGNSLGGIRTVE